MTTHLSNPFEAAVIKQPLCALKTVCAWCLVTMKTGALGALVTHGICPACSAAQFIAVDEADARLKVAE